MIRLPLKHCHACGGPLLYRLPDDGDTRERAICTLCHTVHYENPLNVVGTVASWGDDGAQVLLCKRNIEPRLGKWTLPAGFMELGESSAEGAARETVEEAGATFEMLGLFAVMNVVRVGQLHLVYRARLTSTVFDFGYESQAAQLFTEADIPWDELAFKTNRQALELYFADLKAGHFGVHAIDIA